MVVISTSAGWNFTMGIESSFGSGSGTDIGWLGIGQKITTLTVKNNPEAVYTVGQRMPELYYSKGVDIDFNTEFIFANDNINWIQFVLTGTAAPYTSGNTITSAYANIRTPEGTTWTISGIIFDSAAIDVSQGEAVKVTLNGKGTKLTVTSNAVSPSIKPSGIVTWDMCSAGIGNSQPIQKLGLTINTDAEMFRQLGNLYYIAYLPKKFSAKVETEILHDSGLVENLMATSGSLSATSFTVNIGSHSASVGLAVYEEGGITVEPVNPVIDKVTIQSGSISFS